LSQNNLSFLQGGGSPSDPQRLNSLVIFGSKGQNSLVLLSQKCLLIFIGGGDVTFSFFLKRTGQLPCSMAYILNLSDNFAPCLIQGKYFGQENLVVLCHMMFLVPLIWGTQNVQSIHCHHRET
jgi:hypothetical protein